MSEPSTKTNVCTDCGGSFDGTSRARRCEACRLEDRRAKHRERMRAWRAAQSKVESIQVTCRDCATTFKHETGGTKAGGRVTKTLCASCLKESQRKATREHKARKRAAAKAARPARTCLDCPADISDLHGKMLRCEPCRRELARLRAADWRVENPQPERTFLCIVCSTTIDRRGNSGKPLYCDPCRAAASRASYLRTLEKLRRARGAQPATECHYCGSSYARPRQRARVPSRCEECKKARHRAYVRVYYANNPRGLDHVRRARKLGLGYERFKHSEIFDRDGWKCGICRKQISRRLRWPHPMSVSLDHKIPLSKGGPHSRLNTQAAHLRCNLRKRTAAAPEGEQIPLF